MTRTAHNLMLALLLILTVGGRCVLACVDLSSTAQTEAHKCCKKGKAQTPNCQGQASEAAKAAVDITPPVGEMPVLATVLVAAPVYSESAFQQPDYSPPDLSILHQVFLI